MRAKIGVLGGYLVYWRHPLGIYDARHRTLKPVHDVGHVKAMDSCFDLHDRALTLSLQLGRRTSYHGLGSIVFCR